MKTIMSIFAAVAVLAAASSAQAFDTDRFWEQQRLYGENIDSDAIRSGQTLHPFGFFGADK